MITKEVANELLLENEEGKTKAIRTRSTRAKPMSDKTKRKYVKKEVEPIPVEPTSEEKLVVTKDGYATINGYFKVSEGTYKILKRNIKKKVNTMLLGPTGFGKTELIDNLAKVLDLPITILDMGTMVDPIMGLVGNHTIIVEDGVTRSKFIKSRFSEVIQKPGIVLLDELNRAGAQANNLLFPVLDFRKELSMEYNFEDTTPIKVHPDCVFIATANLGSQYTGTHKIDKALLNRFMLHELDGLSMNENREVIHYLFPTVEKGHISKILTCYENINKAHDEFTISFNLSMRDLKDVVGLVEDGFTIYDSFYSICRGIGSSEGLKAVETILSSVK